MKYDFQKIEKKWQKIWAKDNFKIWHAVDFSQKKRFYLLDMFPYPSGDGLHVGHAEGYTATDIYSRFLRLRGFNVLHPMGWDAFGLPAENFAIKTKTHPEENTKKSVARFKSQMQALGLSYDWQREFSTTDPSYFKFTQWMFLEMFRRGLVYEAQAPINWCPSCKTGLAEEDLEDGVCERCKSTVERRPVRQWVIRITAYAERLLDDLKNLDWPESIKQMQNDWIGRSQGYQFHFRVHNIAKHLEVFTTRIDTIYGATFLVLAPEHPMVKEITTHEYSYKVQEYARNVVNKSDIERNSAVEKTGVFTGSYAIHPITGIKIPIWIADYVTPDYATGAIMGVPAHDQRDFDFAKKYDLSILEVISLDGDTHREFDKPLEAKGVLVNSGLFNGLVCGVAQEKIANYIGAKPRVVYKLKDWVFARQRYWGEPFPLVFCEHCAEKIRNQKIPARRQAGKIKKGEFSEGELLNPGWIEVPGTRLPVTLPKVKSYEPSGTGESPLINVLDWVRTNCPKCKGPARRETDTMPQWAGSCWYYLGFALGNGRIKKKDIRKGWDIKCLKYWHPVDFYVGGVEHATRHLIYARFWHKFLNDLGLVTGTEPFKRLANQGLILGPDGEKMSKSRGNVINPDDVIKQYGADALRLYEMFMGPFEASKPWDTKGIIGVFRFLNRVSQLVAGNMGAQKELFAVSTDPSSLKVAQKSLHQTIKKVTDDIVGMRFNTAISALMQCEGALANAALRVSRNDFIKLIASYLVMLYPFSPHLASELWGYLGKGSIETQLWPRHNPRLIFEDYVTYAIQVNGKMRHTIKLAKSLGEDEVIHQAERAEQIGKWIKGKAVRKKIFVKHKIVNFVI